MFKKTLLAATLAALSTGVMAVDIDTGTTGLTYGSEALSNGFVKNDFTTATLPAVVATVAAEYSVGDVLKINMSGGEFKTTDSFALTVSGTPGDLTLGFLSATANQLVFRVTAVANTATATKTLTLAAGTAVKFDSVAVGAKVNMSFNVETSTGIPIDVTGAKDTTTLATLIQQHKFAATANLDEKVDVADERKALTATSDTATITYTYEAPTFGGTSFVVTAGTGLKLTAKGSFTGFETGVTGSTALGTVTLDSVAAIVATDLQSGSASVALPAVTDTLDIVFTPNPVKASRVVLATGAYTVDAVITDGTYTTTVSDVAIGSFVLNGASENFGYVPVNYGGAVTTQFEIGNKGTVDGEITLTGFDTAGNDYNAPLAFKAEAGKLTKISDADISTAFGLTAGTKLKLTITVNSPATNISMAGYSNRGTTGRMAVSSTAN
jgi:hypothetical protein